MRDLKLTEILSTFTADEIKKFKKFIESPYHNGSENVSRIFREIEKYYPDFSGKNYNLKYIHSKLFPGKKYHDGVIRNLISDLYRLASDFIVIDSMKKHEIDFDINFLKQLKNRGLSDVFNASYKKSISKLNNVSKDDNYFYNLYQLENELWSLFIVDRKTGRKHEEFVNKTIDNSDLLIKFFLARILKSYCSIVSNTVDFKTKPPLKFYNEIKNHIETHGYKDAPVIILYLNSLKLLLGEEDNDTFRKQHKEIRENTDTLYHDDLHVLYISLLNYSIIKKDFKSCFEIFKEIIPPKYYCRKGVEMYMEYGFYSSAVHVAIQCKDFEWAENFIKTNKLNINPPHRDNAYYYHLALLEFFRKNYEKSLELLSNLNPTDFFLLIYTQRLRLMIFLELNKAEEIYYLMDTYKHTLSRHSQIEERHKKSGKEFIDIFRELVRLKENFDEFRYIKLKKKILSENSAGLFRDWYSKKLQEMIQ